MIQSSTVLYSDTVYVEIQDVRVFLFISRNKHFPKGVNVTIPQGRRDEQKFSNPSEIPNPSRIVNVKFHKKKKLDQFEVVTKVLCESVQENRASHGSLSRNSPVRHWYWSTLGKDPCGHSGLRQSSGESRIFPQSRPYISDRLCFSDGRGQVPISGRSLRTAVTASQCDL